MNEQFGIGEQACFGKRAEPATTGPLVRQLLAEQQRHLERRRSAAVVLVGPLLQQLDSPASGRGAGRQLAEQVDHLGVDDDRAPGRQGAVGVFEMVDCLAGGGTGLPRQRGQQLHLEEEAAMVAHQVEHVEPLFVGRAAQTAAELLEEHDRRLGGPEQQDGVDGWHIDTFVEQVDREHDLQVAGSESVERCAAGCRPGA